MLVQMVGKVREEKKAKKERKGALDPGNERREGTRAETKDEEEQERTLYIYLCQTDPQPKCC
jgi:hypothetical protein